MDAKENPLAVSLERLNGLMAWWGTPAMNGNGALDRQMKRFQQLASDFQKTYTDAYRGEVDALLGSSDRVGRFVQDLLRCRRPQEVLVAESELLATLLEGASVQAKRWAELSQKLQECCAAVVREAAADLREQAQETAPSKSEAEAEHRPAKAGRREAAAT